MPDNNARSRAIGEQVRELRKFRHSPACELIRAFLMSAIEDERDFLEEKCKTESDFRHKQGELTGLRRCLNLLSEPGDPGGDDSLIALLAMAQEQAEGDEQALIDEAENGEDPNKNDWTPPDDIGLEGLEGF